MKGVLDCGECLLYVLPTMLAIDCGQLCAERGTVGITQVQNGKQFCGLFGESIECGCDLSVGSSHTFATMEQQSKAKDIKCHDYHGSTGGSPSSRAISPFIP